jgi:general stress protein YciG
MARRTSHRASGIKARNTIIAKHGEQYYARIGKIGGSRTDTKPKGFEADRALARRAGAKGGAASRKG